MNKSEKVVKHRLHPVSMLYFMVTVVKESFSFIWLFPLIVLYVHQHISEQISPLAIGIVSVVVLLMLFLIVVVLRWRSFTYEIHEQAIYIESGLFVTKKRWVTPDRIQSIDSTVRVYDHFFSTRTLTIELAGGEESSITLSCISSEEEKRIRGVLGAQAGDKPADPFGESVIRLSKNDLILHSLLSPRFGAVFTLLSVGFFKYLDVTEEADRNLLIHYLSSWFGANWIVLTLVILLFLSFAISLLTTFTSDYDFTLHRNDKGELEITQGLFEKKKRTIAQNRIQALWIIERPLPRLLGYVSIEAVVIRNGQDKETQKNLTLLPFVQKDMALSILEPLTGYHVDSHLHRLTKKAKFSYMGIPFILGCLLAIPVWLFVPGLYHYAAPLIPLGLFFLGWMEYQKIGWNQSENFLTLQYGKVTRKTALIKRGRVQWASLRQTALQAKKHLASVRVAVASGKVKVSMGLRHIPLAEAEKIYRYTLKPKRGKTNITSVDQSASREANG